MREKAFLCANRQCHQELRHPYRFCSNCGNKIPDPQQRYIAHLIARTSMLRNADDKAMFGGILTFFLALVSVIVSMSLLNAVGIGPFYPTHGQAMIIVGGIIAGAFLLAILNGRRTLLKYRRTADQEYPDLSYEEFCSK